MEDYLNRLLEALGQWHPVWAYGALFFSAFLENVVPPVPGDTVVVFGAYLVGRGALDWWPVYLSTWAGGVAGFLSMYYLGYSRGRAFIESRAGRFFSVADMARAQDWLDRHGRALILANRFLSGIRSVIALSAGIGRMDWRQVAVCGAISMLVWNGLLLYGGLLVGQNWELVLDLLEQYNRIFGTLLAVAVAVFLWRRHRRRRRGEA